jgi:UTP--glucose-1-phosphate uridylyltransferase
VKVRKAVILAAGYGTRFLPASKTVPKEMFPILNRPVIDHIVQEAVDSGLTQIIIVTGLHKHAIEDYFDRDPDLEAHLEAKGDETRLAEVRRTWHLADISFVRQTERKGNGHAVLMARSLIADEPFALFFPDDVIVHDVPAIRQLVAQYEKLGSSVIAVQEVPREEVVHYGVIDPEPVEGRLYRVRRVVEKPPLEEAPSNLTTVGRFVLTPSIIPVLQATPPGRSGEIWLMDALDALLKRESLYAYQYEGERFDTGQPLGLLKAALFFAMRNPQLRDDIARYARTLKTG